MCTITFFPLDEHSYILSTNRDELKSRKQAIPPKFDSINDIQFVRPIDGDKGGTWIAANEHQLSLCIMNWYQAYDNIDQGKTYQTRGNIIHELIDSPDLKSCTHELQHLDLNNYQPFRLVGIQTNPMKVIRWLWDGLQLKIINDPVNQQMWISAGPEYDEVYRKRNEVFQMYAKKNGSISLDDVKKLHASQYPEPGKYAISMSADIAHTVSNTIIYSKPQHIEMHYLDGFPATSDHWVIKDMLTRKEIETSRR